MTQYLLALATPTPVTYQGRGGLVIQNNSATGNCYVDDNETDTTTSGIKLGPGAILKFDVPEQGDAVWLLSDTANLDVRVIAIGQGSVPPAVFG
jgi:hypothetical protein